MRGFTFGAIELFAQNELIALTTGGQAMQTYVTKVSLDLTQLKLRPGQPVKKGRSRND